MKNKNSLWVIFAVVLVAVAVAVFWFMGDDLEHIEDTNGADNYALTTITDQQIIDKSVGALNVSIATDTMSGMVTVSSDKFTGVYEILSTNYIGASDFDLRLYDFAVTSGNFKLCVVHDGEIAAVLAPEQLVDCRLNDISGSVSLVIAGESAEFSFSITENDYDGFSHN